MSTYAFLVLWLMPSPCLLAHSPFFNVARDKPVSVEPETNICGLSAEEIFCQSELNQQSTLSCAQQTCDMSCPYRDSMPLGERISAFDRADSSFSYGGCVLLNAESLAPYPLAVESKEFLGNPEEGSCYMDLHKDWFAAVRLMSSDWTLTFGVWLYYRSQLGRSTVMDFARSSGPTLRLFIERNTIGIQSGNLIITNPKWTVPSEEWMHVAMQVYEKSVSVFINGTLITPAFYNLDLVAPGRTSLYRLGNNQAGDQPFVGLMDEMLIFTTLLTNRELSLMYELSFPELRVMSQCRCPDSHPAPKIDNPLYCVQNEGDGRSPTEEYRIRRGVTESHPMEFINDGDARSAWISSPGQEESTVVLDFLDVYEVHNVGITLYSPYPALITVEHKAYDNDTWNVWQYFSQDCLSETGYQADGRLTYESDVICTYLYDPAVPDAEVPYSSAVISLDLLEGRPGALPDGFTPDLKEFLLSSAIRITLRGHPFVLNEKHKYHAIYEVTVNATCDCNNRGDSCDHSTTPYTCTCSDESYSTGDRCETCVSGTFVYNSGSADKTCLLCDCNTNGTTNEDVACSTHDGQCNCKTYATGRQCDTCQPGYFSLQPGNDEGCQECICNMTGTVNATNECDGITGQCPCKTNVGGLQCGECLPGYYTSNFSSPDGCFYCGCDAAGTLPSQPDCDVTTGGCACKNNVIGKNCDTCKNTFFNLTESNVDGCQDCNCDVMGSVNASCDVSSGQCYCKANITGRTCDKCAVEFYARDSSDFTENGCLELCDCDADGVIDDDLDCEDYGGQCRCKSNVGGRKCDSCFSRFYGLSSTHKEGCLPCECDEAGAVNASAGCDEISGQCTCKSNVGQRACDLCLPGYYGLSKFKEDGCTPCDCSIMGSANASDCDGTSGQCRCLPGKGDDNLAGRQCKPYTQDMHPLHGPESGGTKLRISAGFIGAIGNVTVLVGYHPCDVNLNQSSATTVVCVTRSLTLREQLNQELDVTLHLEDDTPLSAGTFSYNEDPVISEIQPMHTILSGGIVLTVSGEHLTSVAYPMFEIYVTYHNFSKPFHQDVFNSNCTVADATLMKCPTPAIEINDNLLSKLRRRRKRSMEDERLNSDDLTFSFGFILDGVETYRNVTTNRQLGVLMVYENPVFSQFEEAKHIKVFRTYWPFNDEQVAVKGQRLNYGASTNDYVISVGETTATLLELHDNRLAFAPPQTAPEDTVGKTYKNAVDVSIQVGNYHSHVGYLQYETNFWENPTFRNGVIGGACGLILLILLCCCTCCICKRNRRKKTEKDNKVKRAVKLMDNSFDEFTMETTLKRQGNPYSNGFDNQTSGGYMRPDTLIKPKGAAPSSNLLETLPLDLKATVSDNLLDEALLVLGKMIGEGHFGRVYSGRLTDNKHPYKEPVAVKTLREYNINSKDTIQFLEEATLMSDFNHDHVLGLTGVVIRGNHPYVVLPFMENGDLKSFISNDDNMLTVGELIHFGMQIADGMNYLAEKRFVHRDLACRNCMVNRDMVVKVADFGLSRDIYTNDYYRVNTAKRPLPVKWMAVESLENGTFDSRSDVWSFGVVMWELLTRGCQPYPDVDNFDIRTYILCGNRMDRPDYAPDEMYLMMLECWADKPPSRPNFRKIYNRIAIFLDESSTRTVLRNKQGQQVPSIAYRGRSYIDVSNTDRLSFDYSQGQF